MRRASIDRVNAKYGRGGAIVGSALPVAAQFPVATYNTAVVGAPVATTLHGGYVSGGLRRSTVVSQPVYQAVEHPPVYEVVTTPPKVYEIVTPIVEVTPDAVQTTHVEQNLQDIGNQRVYDTRSRGSVCPWWCWLLLGLLLLALLLSALGYLFRQELGLVAANTDDNNDNTNKGGNNEDDNTNTTITNTNKGSNNDNDTTTDEKDGNNTSVSENDDNNTNTGNDTNNTNTGNDANNTNNENSEDKSTENNGTQTTESGAGAGGSSNNEENENTNSNKQLSCKQGAHSYKGKCIECPTGSSWNGTNCVKRVTETKTVTETHPEESSSDSGQQGSQENSQGGNQGASEQGNEGKSQGANASQNNGGEANAQSHHHLRYSLFE